MVYQENGSEYERLMSLFSLYSSDEFLTCDNN